MIDNRSLAYARRRWSRRVASYDARDGVPPTRRARKTAVPRPDARARLQVAC